ncbi:MAG TPA: regulatory iron-sulfur-containing complex subunit RicT [bacterium]|nr:regulatory iron-sulfur-containing complex subunit RicT [bacterium]HOL48680.1 regulatory iron-sulfur-containing complex subunit RicT [bacterium]HPQ19425.1 regulatory iron-sulfur-containing complex subunit RicT [bacterium]
MEYIDVVAVRLLPTNEVKYYDANGLSLKINNYCVVPTQAGDSLAIVLLEKTVDLNSINKNSSMKQLLKVIRKANTNDMLNYKKNLEDAKEALKICIEKVNERELEMKVLDAWYILSRSRLTFNFIADGRIDFRELVKDLAHIFKTRIELYQIGVRDEAKLFGALGICGRVVCCRQFLNDFSPITIQMAKLQCMTLTPNKYSGVCGRLLCCLEYEYKIYEEESKNYPTRNTKVEYQQMTGIVIGYNIFKKTVTLKLDDGYSKELSLEEFKKLKVLEVGKDDTTELESEIILEENGKSKYEKNRS